MTNEAEIRPLPRPRLIHLLADEPRTRRWSRPRGSGPRHPGCARRCPVGVSAVAVAPLGRDRVVGGGPEAGAARGDDEGPRVRGAGEQEREERH